MRLLRPRLALLACLVLLVGAPAAVAAATVGKQAWTADGVVNTFVPEERRIYVAADAGSSQARSFVEIDGAAGGERLVLLEAGDDGLLQERAVITACALVEPIPTEGELDTPLEVDCEMQTPAERRPEPGEWSVPLDVFADAQRPLVGIALIPAIASPTDTFRVAFDVTATTVEAAEPTQPAAAEDSSASVTSPAPSAAPEPAVELPPPADPPPPVGEQPATPAGAAERAGGGVVVEETENQVRVAGASSPSAAAVFLVLLLAGVAALALHGVRSPGSLRPLAPAAWAGSNERGWRTLGIGASSLAVAVPLVADEATLFKAGLVLIVMIAAFGLHILVNWAGELSLAHAGFIGLPAFTVAKLSADHGISPIALLPLAVMIGAVLGAVVGLPALRARGLQVALVTLAAGVAIERFFFTKPWLVGAGGGVNVAVPTIGPLRLTTTRSLYPVLVVALVVAVAFGYATYRSKLGRALLWLRTDPQAAAVFGIPVAQYKTLAYAIAGALAGFAGGLTGVWVQRLTPQAFPFTLSLTYLVIVVVAGRGFLGGVVAAALILEGGRVFSSGAATILSYGGPIMLIVVLTRYKAGLNGIGRQLMRLTDQQQREPEAADGPAQVTPALAVGVGSTIAGFVAIAIAWYHAGNTDELWIQNQELISGGAGGIGLLILGAGLLIRDRIAKSSKELGDRLTAALLSTREPEAVEPPSSAHDVPPPPARRTRKLLTVR